MKSKIFGLLFSLMISLPIYANAPIKIMQYNLYAWNAMTLRNVGSGLVANITKTNPDFITAEEAMDAGNTLNNSHYGLPAKYALAKDLKGAVGVYYNQDIWTMIPNTFIEKELPSKDKYGPRYARGALFVRNSDQKKLYVFATHWSLCGSGKAFEGCNGLSQVKDAEAIVGLVETRADKNVPVIVGGDLNIDKYGGNGNGEGFAPILKFKEKGFRDSFRDTSNICQYGGITDGKTFPNNGAVFKIDYIFVYDGNISKIKTTNATIGNGDPSDHRFVTATIELQ